MLSKINYLSSLKDNRLVNNVNFKVYPSNMFDQDPNSCQNFSVQFNSNTQQDMITNVH